MGPDGNLPAAASGHPDCARRKGDRRPAMQAHTGI